MTREQNVFVAHRNIVEYIYNSAKLEGCKVTFPETQTLLDGVNVGSVTLDDIQTILNLRDAWRFVMQHIDLPFDLSYICRVNERVSRNESLAWGVLRTGYIGISGTDYKPPIPNEADVAAALERIAQINGATERAIRYFLWGCRAQLFWDGNKRTSTLCANKILLEAGEGILTIQDSDVLEFNKRLVNWYNTGDPTVIDVWLYDNCIDGIDFPENEIKNEGSREETQLDDWDIGQG
jgi:Fic family protein